MSDEKGTDDKVVGIHIDDPQVAHYHDVSELPPHMLAELERFFLDYKSLEKKVVSTDAFRGSVEAERVIAAAIDLYAKQIARSTRPAFGNLKSP